jgi:uncharacterized protein (TIGR03435 family)
MYASERLMNMHVTRIRCRAAWAFLAIALAAAAAAQPSDPKLAFDVVSVKPAAFPSMSGGKLVMQRNTGGPGTADPGRIHYPYILMRALLQEAYSLKTLQIEGPDWVNSERFEISATMPTTTTKEQFHVMLQNLLGERFHLVFHREAREVQGYSLVVAKSGAKLKESGSTPAPAEEPAPVTGPLVLAQPKTAADGFPAKLFPPGKPGLMSLRSGARARLVGQLQTTGDLADFISSFLDRPAIDSTGLKGKYDFQFDFSADSMAAAAPDREEAQASDPLPGFFSALQSELGLRLEPKKTPVEMFVIDRLDKRPAEN